LNRNIIIEEIIAEIDKRKIKKIIFFNRIR